MTQQGSTNARSKPKGNKRHPSNVIFTAFDRALINAKQADREVEFHIIDLEDPLVGKICSVDTYTVEVELSTGKEWLFKNAMTRVVVK